MGPISDCSEAMMPRMAFSDVKKFVASWRKELVVMGVGLAGLGVVALILWLPPWQAEHVRGRLDQPADEYRLATLADGHRRTLAQILTGGGLLVGLYLGWRRVRAAEEGQITDRFTKAIEQLGQEGDDKMAIRLGGIYALERIAKDSEKDHGPIMEILTAYVRENAPRQEEDIPTLPAKMPTDIQAILTVIGRRETTGENRGNGLLDLTHTQLAEANLQAANLTGVNLQGANLQGAVLYEANLTPAVLAEAKLFGASFQAADMRGAYLGLADLGGAFLSGAQNLTAEQVLSTKNWHHAFLPEDLQYLKEPPV